FRDAHGARASGLRARRGRTPQQADRGRAGNLRAHDQGPPVPDHGEDAGRLGGRTRPRRRLAAAPLPKLAPRGPGFALPPRAIAVHTNGRLFLCICLADRERRSKGGRSMRSRLLAKTLLLAVLLGRVLTHSAIAQSSRSAADSGFSFDVYGDSRSMMYLPY